jgi:hypothetical protein
MVMLLNLIGSLLGLAAFVCWIMVTVKFFQKNDTVLGILSIITCGIAALIGGWIKARPYNMEKLMQVFTGTWVGSVVINALVYAMSR